MQGVPAGLAHPVLYTPVLCVRVRPVTPKRGKNVGGRGPVSRPLQKRLSYFSDERNPQNGLDPAQIAARARDGVWWRLGRFGGIWGVLVAFGVFRWVSFRCPLDVRGSFFPELDSVVAVLRFTEDAIASISPSSEVPPGSGTVTPPSDPVLCGWKWPCHPVLSSLPAACRAGLGAEDPGVGHE